MSDTKPQAPLIGEDFSGPRDNGPRVPLQSKEDEDVGAILSEAVSTPTPPLTAPEKAKKYREELEKADIPLVKAREILDAVIFKDCYREDKVLLGRLKVGIRTRIYDDLQRIMKALEEEAPAFPAHTDDLIARYNVAASLAYYKDTQFAFPDPKTATFIEIAAAFEIRMKFLLGLPTPVISCLIDAVGKFDNMVAAVFAEGAPEDF